MSREADNERFARIVQRWLRDGRGRDEVAVDGWAGTKTRRAWSIETGFVDTEAQPGPRPDPDDRALRSFFGAPGDESNLVMLELPYPMRLAWQLSTTVTRARCHKLVADPLRAALEGVREYHGGDDELREAGMDRFGGIYNYRRQRGHELGRPWSLHAWGAAVDIDPLRNQLHMPWPHADPAIYEAAVERWRTKVGGEVVDAKMPPEIVEIFEQVGWKSGGRAWGRDAMHFQWTL